jgi:hypothetical protein
MTGDAWNPRRWFTGAALVVSGSSLSAWFANALLSQVQAPFMSVCGDGTACLGVIHPGAIFPPLLIWAWIALCLVPLLTLVSPRVTQLSIAASVVLIFSVIQFTTLTPSVQTPQNPLLVSLLLFLLLDSTCIAIAGSLVLRSAGRFRSVRRMAPIPESG